MHLLVLLDQLLATMISGLFAKEFKLVYLGCFEKVSQLAQSNFVNYYDQADLSAQVTVTHPSPADSQK